MQSDSAGPPASQRPTARPRSAPRSAPPSAPRSAPPSASPSPPPRPIPLALYFSAAALVLHDFLQLVAAELLKDRGTTDHWGDFELRKASWNLLLRATGFAVYPLLLAGALELLRTTSGPARRGAKLAVATAVTGAAGTFASEALQVYSSEAIRQVALFSAIWRVAFELRQLSWLAFTFGLLWSGWSERPVRRLTWMVVLGCVAAHPPSPMMEWMSPWLYQRDRFPAYTAVTDLFYVVVLGIALQHRPAPARPDETLGDGSWARTTRAVARQHRAVAALFWVTLLGASATLLVFLSDRGPGARTFLNQLWALGLPSLHLVAIAVLIAALCRAAATDLDGAPRRRLYAAATLYAVFAGIRAIQLAHRALLFPELALEARVWPLLLPALGGAAPFLLAWSLCGFADLLASPPQRARTTTTLLVVGGCQLAVLAVYARLHYATGPSLGASVPHTLVALLLSLAGLLSLVRTSSAMAEELSTRVDLPAAVLRR